MGKIISVEKSQFINKQINIYSKNKVGQYSKYLDKNPIFVTYYSINHIISRADIGTGAVSEEYGPKSPIRYNKISEFPIYGIPELKPSAEYDETGFDIALDLNGLIILPNTIKPVIGDVFIISIPSISTQILARVNNFEYNTIQANDFYQIDAEMKRTGKNVETEITSQIVEEYVCIFENIGTEDKCIVKTTDYKKSEDLLSFINNLRLYYDSTFYNKETGDYLLFMGYDGPHGFPSPNYYDIFLARFINDSKICYDEFSNETRVLLYSDAEPFNFDYLYQHSLFWAILNRNVKFLSPYMYRMCTDISKTYSVYKLYDIPCTSNALMIFKEPIDPASSAGSSPPWVEPYFDHDLLLALHNKDTSYETDDYFNFIVYNYIMGNEFEIDDDKIMSLAYTPSIRTYTQIPIILYILIQKYNEYYVNNANV